MMFGAHAAGLRRALLLTVLAIVLAGCSLFGSKSSESPVEVNVLPTNYRVAMLEFLRTKLTDPSNVRDAYISEPTLQPIGTDTRYVICVRFNSKDGYGQYTGSRDNIAIYFAGKLTQFVSATREQCGNVPYQRFPELETLTKPASQ
jgi:hypothetical protein